MPTRRRPGQPLFSGQSPSGGISAYQTAVIADNPVAYWPLNELTGTVANDYGSGTPDPGTYTNGPLLGQPGVDGADPYPGTSVFFDGTDDHITMGALASKLQFASGADFSVEAWVAFEGRLTTPGAAVVGEAYAGDGTVRYTLGFHNGGTNTVSRKPSFGWYNGAWRKVDSAVELTDSAWHHLVGTYNGGTNQLELWVDGASVGTLTPGGSQPGGTESLYVGRRWDGGGNQYFNGYIDQVAIYGSRLSSSRILAHYGARSFTPAADLVTAVWTEVAIADATIKPVVTGIWAEAAVEEFWHGFGTPEYGDADADIAGIMPGQPGFINASPPGTGKGRGRAKSVGVVI